MKTKISYGIALCRNNKEKNNAVEIVLIKKRYSYHYQSFVMGHYKKNDYQYIKYLLDHMSFSEKMDIMSMQFNHMWYRIWLNNPEKYYNITDMYKYEMGISDSERMSFGDRTSNIRMHKMYFQKKNKFEQNFRSKSDIQMLRSLIYQSTSSELIWEIPKGRKNSSEVSGTSPGEFASETNLDCAIREFYEETSIDTKKYKIRHNVEPVISSFVDEKIVYKTIYYIAELRDQSENLIPHINYKSFHQVSEIEQIKWVSLAEINFLNLPEPIHTRLIMLYKTIIWKYKNRNY
jgi:8-oxo-dGTP pyrophosphatase MutT (NUDIX family)